MEQRKKISLCLLLLILLALGLQLWPRGAERQQLSGKCFGTFYHISLYSDKKDPQLSGKIEAELAQITAQMSIFDPLSEISRINQAEAGSWLQLSPEMATVLRQAQEVYQWSKGCFDPSIGPIIELWGFGRDKSQQGRIPSAQELEQARDISGFHRLQFKPDYRQLKKADAALAINLSAIAKGYGVDRIASLLREEGYTNFLVEIGGEVFAQGQPSPPSQAWHVLLEHAGSQATTAEDSPTLILTLHNQGLATSGNYRNFFEQKGQHYAHTISPQSAQPINNGLTAVSVVADSTMLADALATAIMAMPRQDIPSFLQAIKAPVHIYAQQEDGQIWEASN